MPVALLRAQSGNKTADLRRVLKDYSNAWSSQNYAAVWRMMSPKLKRGNDDEFSVFESYIRKSGLVVFKIKVMSIRNMDSSARVKAQVYYRSSKGVFLGDELQEWMWNFDGREWLYDGSQSIR